MSEELDWDKCEKQFRALMHRYGELLGEPGVNVMPALQFILQPLLKRFVNGERTQELYDEMMSAE